MKNAILALLILSSCSKSQPATTITLSTKTQQADKNYWVYFALNPGTAVSTDNIHLSAVYHFDWFYGDSVLYRATDTHGLYAGSDSLFITCTDTALFIRPSYNSSKLNARNFRVDTVFVTANPSGNKVVVKY